MVGRDNLKFGAFYLFETFNISNSEQDSEKIPVWSVLRIMEQMVRWPMARWTLCIVTQVIKIISQQLDKICSTILYYLGMYSGEIPSRSGEQQHSAPFIMHALFKNSHYWEQVIRISNEYTELFLSIFSLIKNFYFN